MPAHEPGGDRGDAAFERAKRPLFVAIAATVVGLAIAGSLDRTTGGALVLGAWAVGIFALHRLGRVGSDRPRDSDRPREDAPPDP
ncbi:MAG: hypothetical protein JWP97_6384 [Labilithrix sp.]|nr:hypothetical protein [Labilithrix sp.]